MVEWEGDQDTTDLNPGPREPTALVCREQARYLLHHDHPSLLVPVSRPHILSHFQSSMNLISSYTHLYHDSFFSDLSPSMLLNWGSECSPSPPFFHLSSLSFSSFPPSLLCISSPLLSRVQRRKIGLAGSVSI